MGAVYADLVIKHEDKRLVCVVLQYWQDLSQGPQYQLHSLSYYCPDFEQFDGFEERIESAVSKFKMQEKKLALKAGKQPEFGHEEIHTRMANLMRCGVEETKDDNHNHMVAQRDLSADEIQQLKTNLHAKGFSSPIIEAPKVVGKNQSI